MFFEDIALQVPRLLLPRHGTDLTRWSVIACDQYTSEPEYWHRVKSLVAEAPSMLHLIYPEVYMPEKRDEEIIANIEASMKLYMEQGILQEHRPGFVLVDRQTPGAMSRKGLVVALDLEHYSFEQGSQSLIRATEKTIESRLPPRIAIREKASVESPHILILIDDREKTVIEPLYACRHDMAELYNFELMENSGHLTGYHVTSREHIDKVAAALRALGENERFRQKHGTDDGNDVILYAVGDGNHSLAAAKRCWQALKSAGAPSHHPGRFALVEINNIHDEGLHVYPIHRLVENVDVNHMIDDMQAFFAAQSSAVLFEDGGDLGRTADAHVAYHHFELCSKERSGVYSIAMPSAILPVATLDSWLNTYLSKNQKASIDYVHEAHTVRSKSQEANVAGFLLPALDSNDLLGIVAKEGMLPRKTFSMGHAPEKRFYFECKRIV